MSIGDNVPVARDSGSAAGPTAVSDIRMSNEAFDHARNDALRLTQSGSLNFSPDTSVSGPKRPTFSDIPGLKDTSLQVGHPAPIIPSGKDVWQSTTGVESTASKIGREALVIGSGVGESFFYGVANLPNHMPQIGSSIMIGGTLGAIARTGKLGTECAMVVGAYFTSRFILDTINDHKRWEKFGAAVKDTWASSDNFSKNVHDVRDTFGNYAFDTTLSLASSYVGYQNPQLGELILGVLRVPPIVPNSVPAFHPAVTTAMMYMDMMPPSGFYKNLDEQNPYSPTSWKFDMSWTLHKVPNVFTPNGSDNYNPYGNSEQKK